MIRVKINLLPKEIKDRRRTEKFLIAAIVAIALFGAVFAAAYSYNLWRVKEAESDLALSKSESARLEASAQALRVYEDKMAEVNGKKAVADRALFDRIEWSKQLEELMLVTPNDISIESLAGNSGGIAFSGTAADPPDDASVGHKPVAKWLIRLADTSQKPDVWLTSSDKSAGTTNLRFSNTLKFKTVPSIIAGK